MPAKDAALARALLDRMYGGIAYTPPATYYVALYYSTTIDQDTVGLEMTSGQWGNYTRLAVPNNTTNWGPATSAGVPSRAKVWNNVDIRWPLTTGVISSLSAQAVALWDAATGGNRTHWGVLTGAVTIITGTRPVFLAGSLIVEEL